ncbi:ribonuclease H-like domain-containing protein [Tanacetum coccineum]
MAKQDAPPPTITAMKIPIIKKGEYDIWSMRMRQYICHTDHNLWDIIVNGDLQEDHAPTGEQTSPSAPPSPKTAKQLAAKRNHERVKSILLLVILDEYLLKFHNVPNAKSLWKAIKSRFGGNEEFKKMKKNVYGALVSKENINKKFLRSLPPSWSQIALIMRNKPDIDQVDIDDLYNNLRVYKDEMKSTASGDFRVSTAGGTSQVSSTPCAHESKVECYNCHKKWHFARECRTGRNQGRRFYGDNGRSNAPTNESSSQALVAQDSLGGYDWNNDFEVEPVHYALMAISSSSSSSSSDKEVQNCSKQCVESFKSLQRKFDNKREKHNRARLEIQGYELALESLESRILGHKKNVLAWGEKYEFQNYELNQMSARDKIGLGYGTQLDEMSNKSETDSEISLSVFDVRSSDEETTPANDRSTKADGYHVVPPPITGNFLTPRANISFAGLDEFTIRKKIIESQTTELNTDTKKKLSEDWYSDDKDDVSEVSLVKTKETQIVKTRVDKIGQTSKKAGLGFKKTKACFVCKSTDHLIKDCDFYEKKSPEPKLKNVVNAGQRVVKPVWDSAKRNRAVHNVSTVRPVSNARPVGTARGQSGFGSLREHTLIMYPKKVDLSYSRRFGASSRFFLKVQALVDSGCSKICKENKAYLSDYEDYNGGFMAFGSDPKGGLENQLNHKFKIIRCDNGTEFKNHAMNEFYAKKGIKREFSVARTP